MEIAELNPKRSGLSLLTAALLASAVTAIPQYAKAASWYWGPGGASMVPRPMHHKPHGKSPKAAERVAEKSVPEGPLIIAISIQHQHLKVFDVNGLYAETPISTGMPGHATPMGVFSVLEKQRWHRSNIYSGAPMPYMQRITWSGVAIHEGVLPGYPASHGCIRMPGAFAVKMFSWTKRGARVIVVPGEISIDDFSHPKLIAHMVDEQKFASLTPASGAPREATLIDKADDAKPELKLATLADASAGNLALTRTTAGEKAEADDAKVADKIADEQTSEAPTKATPVVTQTQSEGAVAATDPPAEPAEEMPAGQTVEQAIDRAAAMVEPAPVQLDAPQLANDNTPAAETTATAAPKPVEPTTTLPAPKPELAASPPEAIPTPPSATTASVPAASAPTQSVSAPATDPNDIPTVIGPKRTGHIAVFISRRDHRLYVRQNFEPVFDVPVTIADPDKPFGTFVFTARGDKDDATALHWSVVTMPYAIKKTVAMPAHVGKKMKAIVETSLAAPPSTAAEALDRITVPDWALQRVAEAIKPGGSLIISDRGLGDETGEGTDFIVPLR